jgi:hypothetical protein
MNVPVRLATFGATLVLVSGGAALAGGAIDPDRDAAGAETKGEPMGGHGGGEGAERAAHPIRGLAVAENGLRLVVDDPQLRRSRPETLRFRVVDDRGATVRDFDVEHTKRMHLVIARRDLTGFQHLHPKQDADGRWSVPVELPAAGSYRVFADFSYGDEPVTLASDLRVDGPADLQPLPAPSSAAVSDGGYDVQLHGARARPGHKAALRFTITKDGRAVRTETYLGAGGHLVALREGDLAFLHVHPEDDGVAFAATFPTAGQYRLFLQFQHAGRVQTVAFTQEVR